MLAKKKMLPRKAERAINDAFEMHDGWLLNFSDATMERWFDEEFNLDLNQIKYHRIGASKAKRFREFVLVENPHQVARVLRSLWQYRLEETNFPKSDPAEEARIQKNLFDFIGELEGDTGVAGTDVIEVFQKCETLAELVDAIRRDLDAGRPSAGLDRLHTYAIKRFNYLLLSRGGSFAADEPLHSRVGKYIKLLEQEAELTEMTRKMLKSNIGIFEQFNLIRNNRSLAHDNELVRQAEARYMFESIAAALRFFKAIDDAHFDDGGAKAEDPEFSLL